MKALEKDRTRRYETANGLARDVERYLADEPVEACPPSAGYRLRKFARQHRGGSGDGGGVRGAAGRGDGDQHRAGDPGDAGGGGGLAALAETKEAKAKTDAALAETKEAQGEDATRR